MKLRFQYIVFLLLFGFVFQSFAQTSAFVLKSLQEDLAQNQLLNEDSLLRNTHNFVLNLQRKGSSKELDSLKIEGYKKLYLIFNNSQFKISNLDSALFYTKKVIDLSRKNGMRRPIVSAMDIQARIYEKKLEFTTSLKIGLEALKLLNEFPEKDKNISVLNETYSIVANSYTFIRDYDNAIKYHQILIDNINEAIENGNDAKELNLLNRGLYYKYSDIADVLFAKKDFEKSYVYYKKSFETLGKYNSSKIQKAASEVNMARAQIQLGNYNEALSLVNLALPEFILANHNHFIFESYYYLAQVNYLKGNSAEAYQNLIQAKTFVEGSLSITRKRDFYELLYKMEKERGQISQALAAHESFIALKDTLLSKQMTADLYRMQREMEVSKIELKSENERIKSQEIQKRLWLALISGIILLIAAGFAYRFLKNKNKEIAYLNSNLEKKVEERTAELQKAYFEIKDALAKGQGMERQKLAVDLNENLAIVMDTIEKSLSTIDVSKLTENEKDIYRNITSMTGDATREITLLANNLHPNELIKEGMENALRNLINQLNILQETKFVLEYHITYDLSQSQIINIYAIVLELCNNIIRYSEASEAFIDLYQNDTSICVNVTDNGNGFQLDSNNIDGRVGLKNVKQRTAEIQGDFEVKQLKIGGIQCFVSIPC